MVRTGVVRIAETCATLDVSAVRRLEFAQTGEGRRIDTDVGSRTVRPRAQVTQLAVGVRAVRGAVHG